MGAGARSEATARALREPVPDRDRGSVDDHRHDEEDGSQRDERLGVQRFGRLIELVGDDAREGETGREDGSGRSVFTEFPMTSVTAIVSPIARPSPRMTAAANPVRPIGITGPCGSRPTSSRRERGSPHAEETEVEAKTSRVTAVVIGTIMIETITPATK